MKCSDARHLIHLSVGDDNLPEEEQSLAEHLHTCAECRSYNAGMVDAMQVLHDFRDSSAVVSEQSVWASVERRIEDRKSMALSAQRPQRQFHGGIVALCACSLVLAFVTIVQNLPVNDAMVDNTHNVPGHFINASTQSPGQPGHTVAVPTHMVQQFYDQDGRPLGWYVKQADPVHTNPATQVMSTSHQSHDF